MLGIVAHHLKPLAFCQVARRRWATARSAGSRRRSTSSCWRGSPSRIASAATGNFDCSAIDWFLERARALGVEHAPPAPVLLGRHLLALGVQPGPRMGEILQQVYEQQLDGRVVTIDDAIAAARDILAAGAVIQETNDW